MSNRKSINLYFKTQYNRKLKENNLLNKYHSFNQVFIINVNINIIII